MYEMDLTLDIHSDLCPMAVSAEQPPEQLSQGLRPWQLRLLPALKQYMAAALSLAPVCAAECACVLQEDDKFRLLLSRTLNVDGSDGANYFDKVGQAVAASLCQP